MAQFENIRNVRELPENPTAYLCVLDLTIDGVTETAEYCARENGGGICDAVIEAIANGEHEGDIAPYSPPTPTQDDLLAALAAHRYQVETGGITFGGMTVLTDDRSKLMINGALAAAQRDANFTTKWKTQAGFVTLNATQIIAVADAVAAHVSSCFESEATVSGNIANYATSAEVLTAFDSSMAA